MIRKYKVPLILLAAAAVVYFLFFKNKTSILIGGDPSKTVDPVVVKRFPPPGYSGPNNGPYFWAGMGTATHGTTFIGWTAAEAQAKGYNWS